MAPDATPAASKEMPVPVTTLAPKTPAPKTSGALVATPAASVHKRKPSASLQTPSIKKRKHSATISTAEAVGNLADAMIALAGGNGGNEGAIIPAAGGGASASNQPTSPVKKQKAWEMILKEGLDSVELAAARKIFRGNSEIAEEYLSFGEGEELKEARLIWLRGEIARVSA